MANKKVKDSCYLLSKGKDFQAIHNVKASFRLKLRVVTYWVKVKIFKQFTTLIPSCRTGYKLLLTE